MQPGKSPLAGVRSRRGSARNGSNDSPIQHDELRIEPDQGDVEVVVFNRAILLFTTDSEAVRRIHQVCCRPGGHRRVTPPGVTVPPVEPAGCNPSAEADSERRQARAV